MHDTSRRPTIVPPVLMLIFLLSIAGLLGVCATPLGPFVNQGAATPEEAILSVTSPEENQNFRVEIRRAVPRPYEAVMVLYSTQNTDYKALRLVLVERRRWGWYYATGSGFRVPSDEDAVWIDYYDGLQQGESGVYYAVYGYPVSPRVTGVEVTFTNGQTLRDDLTNGVFLIFISGSDIYPCAVRALDAHGQELLDPRPLDPHDSPPDPRCATASQHKR